MAMDKETERSYLAIRNRIMNDFGITKDDIKAWIKEMVLEHIRCADPKIGINAIAIKTINDMIKDEYGGKSELHHIIAKEIVERMAISMKG